MNKNKIIFGILGAILLVIVVFLIINLNSGTSNIPKTSTSGDVNIQLYGHDGDDFQAFISEFKSDTGKHQNKNILIESFSDYETYVNTLSAVY